MKNDNFKRKAQRKINLWNKMSIDLLKQEIIMTGEKVKDRIDPLKKKKHGLKNDNFKGKVQKK